MLRPSFAFSAAGALAALSWLCLSVSLFIPHQFRSAVWNATTIGVPAVLGMAYAVLLSQGLLARTGGGFGSLHAVRRLFTSDAALAAGWLHYLAFDLFVGSWIAHQGLDAGLPRLLILPCLMLTFLAGPVGLLLFFIFGFAMTGRLGISR